MAKVYRQDSWRSAQTGLGGRRDKLKSYWFDAPPKLTVLQCNELFAFNDLAKKVCSLVPEEALSEPWVTSMVDKDLQRDLADRLNELDALSAIIDGCIFGRVAGDCFVYVDVVDGKTIDQPLVPEEVQLVNFVRKVERDLLRPATFYGDFKNPKFGQPESYVIGMQQGSPGVIAPEETVHETRFLKFVGARTADFYRRQDQWWHFSVLQCLHDVLRAFGVGWQNAMELLQVSVQGVYSVKGLVDIINSGNAERLSQRIEGIDAARGAAKSLVVDAEGEDFKYAFAPMSGIPDVLEKFMQRVAAAADMPVTKLWGTSPAGMNATGESDAENWYRVLRSYRRDEIQPQVEWLTRCLMSELGHLDDDWSIVWPPLDMPSETEAADIRLKMAQADQINITNQIYSPEEAAEARYAGPDGFSIETPIDMERREQLLDEQAEEDAAIAEQMSTQSADDDGLDPELDPEREDAESKTFRTGRRGGRFYVTVSGQKVYETKGVIRARSAAIKARESGDIEGAKAARARVRRAREISKDVVHFQGTRSAATHTERQAALAPHKAAVAVARTPGAKRRAEEALRQARREAAASESHEQREQRITSEENAHREAIAAHNALTGASYEARYPALANRLATESTLLASYAKAGQLDRGRQFIRQHVNFETPLTVELSDQLSSAPATERGRAAAAKRAVDRLDAELADYKDRVTALYKAHADSKGGDRASHRALARAAVKSHMAELKAELIETAKRLAAQGRGA